MKKMVLKGLATLFLSWQSVVFAEFVSSAPVKTVEEVQEEREQDLLKKDIWYNSKNCHGSDDAILESVPMSEDWVYRIKEIEKIKKYETKGFEKIRLLSSNIYKFDKDKRLYEVQLEDGVKGYLISFGLERKISSEDSGEDYLASYRCFSFEDMNKKLEEKEKEVFNERKKRFEDLPDLVNKDVYVNTNNCKDYGFGLDVYIKKDEEIYKTNGYEKITIKSIFHNEEYTDYFYNGFINNNEPAKLYLNDRYISSYATGDECIVYETLEMRVKREAEEADRAEKVQREIAKRPSPRIGMTKKQAQNINWGTPSKINYTITNGARTEQWVFGDGYYLYFTNGKLTAIQGNK